MKVLKARSDTREQLVDITRIVSEYVTRSGLREGVCTLFVQHTTAGLTINENADPSVRDDFESTFNNMVPRKPTFLYAYFRRSR
jgi:secondary thiamine-phosphate synthase enzyme